MAQVNITLEMEVLKGLFTSDGKDKAFARLLETILNQVLEAQVTERIGAAPYERSNTREAYRNGSRSRGFTTRVGSLRLNVPRLRNGEFTTELFTRYQRSEQALVLAMMEIDQRGIDPEGAGGDERVVRRVFFQVHGVQSVQSVRPCCGSLQEPSVGEALSFCHCGCFLHKGPGEQAGLIQGDPGSHGGERRGVSGSHRV